jgi:hypothetical protein
MLNIEEMMKMPEIVDHIRKCKEFEKELLAFLEVYATKNEDCKISVLSGVMATTLFHLMNEAGWPRVSIETKVIAAMDMFFLNVDKKEKE